MTAPRRIVQGLVLVTSIGLAGWLVASANAKPPPKASSPDAGTNAAADGGSPAKKRVYFPATKAPGRFATEDDEGLAEAPKPKSPDAGPAGGNESGQARQKRSP